MSRDLVRGELHDGIRWEEDAAACLLLSWWFDRVGILFGGVESETDEALKLAYLLSWLV